MASNYVNFSGGTFTGGLTYYYQVLGNTISTSSTTYQDTGLLITPPLAGTYLVVARGSLFVTGNGSASGLSRLATQVGATTTAVASTVGETRTSVAKLIGNNSVVTMNDGGSMSMAIVSVNGTTSIKWQYALGTAGNSTSLANRSLLLIKVG